MPWMLRIYSNFQYVSQDNARANTGQGRTNVPGGS